MLKTTLLIILVLNLSACSTKESNGGGENNPDRSEIRKSCLESLGEPDVEGTEISDLEKRFVYGFLAKSKCGASTKEAILMKK